MPSLDRRTVLSALAAGTVAGLAGCSSSCPDEDPPSPETTLRWDDQPAGPLSTTPSTEWPSPRFDAGNTGFAADATIPSESPALRWQTDVSTVDSAGTPIVADGLIFLWTEGGLAAFDVRDGTSVWTNSDLEVHRFGNEESVRDGNLRMGTVPPVADGDGTLFVSGGAELTAVDVDDGTVRWEYTTSSEFGLPAVVGGDVYVTSRDGIVALDGADGTEHWLWAADLGPEVLAATDDTVVLWNDDDDTVRAFDAASGERRWTVDSVNPGLDGYPVVSDGLVYLADGWDVTAVGLVDGDQRWRFSRDDGGKFTPPIVTDETLYVVEIPGESRNATFALDRTDGNPSPRWCSEVRFGQTLAASNDHALAEFDDQLVTFEAELGNSPWEFVPTGYTPRAAVLDSLVVAFDRSGTLVALGEA
jgi:outer membrane protein assembly factor BamB